MQNPLFPHIVGDGRGWASMGQTELSVHFWPPVLNPGRDV
jgi:hypothetical protein